MSARSFYIAASSSEDGVKAAKSLASRLEGAGLVNRMAWWECLLADEEEWPFLAARDLTAAVQADLFVLLPEPKSYGACVEFGARLSCWSSGAAVVVGPGAHPFFGRHPRVRRVESVDVLLAVLAGEAQA